MVGSGRGLLTARAKSMKLARRLPACFAYLKVNQEARRRQAAADSVMSANKIRVAQDTSELTCPITMSNYHSRRLANRTESRPSTTTPINGTGWPRSLASSTTRRASASLPAARAHASTFPMFPFRRRTSPSSATTTGTADCSTSASGSRPASASPRCRRATIHSTSSSPDSPAIPSSLQEE